MDTNIILEISKASKSAIHIKPFAIGSATAVEQDIDLTDWQGKTFRLYAEQNGEISTDQEHGHYWILAEAAISDATIINSVDDQGNMVQHTEPLDLTTTNFIIFDLPKGV